MPGASTPSSCTIGSHGYVNNHTQAMQSSRFKSNMAINACNVPVVVPLTLPMAKPV